MRIKRVIIAAASVAAVAAGGIGAYCTAHADTGTGTQHALRLHVGDVVYISISL